VQQLDELYPQLGEESEVAGPTSTIRMPVEHLDLATVINVSQRLAGETVLETLLDTVMRTAIQNAGAERGLLILSREADHRIVAEAKTIGNAIVVEPRDERPAEGVVPESVLHYVLRTQESVILDDGLAPNPFSADPYMRQHCARSILCLPLINQAKLIGALYLENNLAARIFAPGRITILKLLASQAAISLENSRLYRDVKRTEQALRESERSLRSAIDGIPGLVGVLAPNGEVEAVNRQLLEYYGQPLEEVRNWGTNGMVHSDDLSPVFELFTKSIASGVPFDIEARLRRFDGEYRWFALRAVPIRDDSGRITRWYVLLTDIEDRTQALARLQQMQSDFSHMNRVSMMGELAASLSHEIAQPIASARNNARAAQNFLKMQPPDQGDVREALSCVVGDADRAGEIIDRIREQIKKAPPRKECFDLNVAINEVIVLARSVTLRNGVSVQTRLAEGLSVLGDRVQLQQVLLNLILNAAEAMGSMEEGARELLISTDEDQAGVVVAVRDSGPGIDPDERVFDAFYTTKPSGTGMGLSICRSIIHAHGGKLWAQANEPRGAVLQFTLPGAERELTPPPQASLPT
jgi:PAS domain S-box-containing protein